MMWFHPLKPANHVTLHCNSRSVVVAAVAADYLVDGDVWPCILIRREPYILLQHAQRFIRRVAGESGTSPATINRWTSASRVRTIIANLEHLRFYREKGWLAQGSSVAALIRLQDIAKFLRYKMKDDAQQHPRLLAQLEQPTAAVQLVPQVPPASDASMAAAEATAASPSAGLTAAPAAPQAPTILGGAAVLGVTPGSLSVQSIQLVSSAELPCADDVNMTSVVATEQQCTASVRPSSNMPLTYSAAAATVVSAAAAASTTSMLLAASGTTSMLLAASRHLPNMAFSPQQLQQKRYKLAPNHHMMPVIKQQLQQMQRFFTTPIDLARPKEQNCIVGQTWDTIEANVLRCDYYCA